VFRECLATFSVGLHSLSDVVLCVALIDKPWECAHGETEAKFEEMAAKLRTNAANPKAVTIPWATGAICRQKIANLIKTLKSKRTKNAKCSGSQQKFTELDDDVAAIISAQDSFKSAVKPKVIAVCVSLLCIVFTINTLNRMRKPRNPPVTLLERKQQRKCERLPWKRGRRSKRPRILK
jgi:hypothetical protein